MLVYDKKMVRKKKKVKKKSSLIKTLTAKNFIFHFVIGGEEVRPSGRVPYLRSTQ